MQAALQRHLPIIDPTGTVGISYIDLTVQPCSRTPEQCLATGSSYTASVYAKLRFTLWGGSVSGPPQVIEVLDRDIFVAEIPALTPQGAFILNGGYRAIINQVVKAPGVIVDRYKQEGLQARIMPSDGRRWFRVSSDNKGLHVGSGKKRMNAVTFLQAFNMGLGDIAKALFVGVSEVSLENGEWKNDRGRRVRKQADLCLAQPVTRAGLVLYRPGTPLASVDADRLKGGTYKVANLKENQALALAFATDPSVDEYDALIRCGSKLVRPDSGSSLSDMRSELVQLLRATRLDEVGRARINRRLRLNGTSDRVTLEDVVATMRHFCEVLGRKQVDHYEARGGKISIRVDDLDHYANRRLRPAGESLGIQFELGVVRAVRAAREKLATLVQADDTACRGYHRMPDPKKAFPADVIAKTVKDFLSSSSMVQPADTDNPLAEVEQKRRVTTLGPGGLQSEDSASARFRDVHYSQNGRICPITTPEGGKIGLILHLANKVHVDENGEMLVPYQNVKTGAVELLSAEDEYDTVIVPYAEDLKKQHVQARVRDSLVIVPSWRVTHREVHPAQMVAPGAALVPFLDHNDANRALMGANMQRQAVPLLRAQAPLVGTGLERDVIRGSSVNLTALRAGLVVYASASRVVVQTAESTERLTGRSTLDVYRTRSYEKLTTHIAHSQRIVVKAGDRVKKGAVIAEGFGSDRGELALGTNLTVAYMTANGYNFEDSFVLSERVVKDGVFAYTDTEKLVCRAMGGNSAGGTAEEEVTNDILDRSAEQLARLDARGIITIGSYVKPGDLLVGKVTPRISEDLSPEDRLLEALMGVGSGALSRKVKDSSLVCPEGVEGVVTNIHVLFTDGSHTSVTLEDSGRASIQSEREAMHGLIAAEQKRLEGKARTREGQLQAASWAAQERESLELRLRGEIEAFESASLDPGVLMQVEVTISARHQIRVGDKLALRHGMKGVTAIVHPEADMPFMEDGTPVDMLINPLGVPSRMNVGQLMEVWLGLALWRAGQYVAKIADERGSTKAIMAVLKLIFTRKADRIRLFKMGTEALYRQCQEWRDGIPMSTPAFSGVKESQIRRILKAVGESEDGKHRLRDPVTGEYYGDPTGEPARVTVGRMYVMLLDHLVNHKVHARSTGPYSAITQQPLGGRSNAGAQRLGEMEVTALIAYGAAYNLKEMLSIKSDDIDGRAKAFKIISRGDPLYLDDFKDRPAASRLLVKELRSMALDVREVDGDTGRGREGSDDY